LSPYDEAGPFQHLVVLRDGGKRHVERLGGLVDRRLTSCETGRIARRVPLASTAKVSLSPSSSVAVVIATPPDFPSLLIKWVGNCRGGAVPSRGGCQCER